MATMNAEQFAQFMAAIMSKLSRVEQGAANAESGPKNLVETMGKRLETFTGANFIDWKFKVRTAVRAYDNQTAEFLDWCEKGTVDQDGHALTWSSHRRDITLTK